MTGGITKPPSERNELYARTIKFVTGGRVRAGSGETAGLSPAGLRDVGLFLSFRRFSFFFLFDPHHFRFISDDIESPGYRGPRRGG